MLHQLGSDPYCFVRAALGRLFFGCVNAVQKNCFRHLGPGHGDRHGAGLAAPTAFAIAGF